MANRTTVTTLSSLPVELIDLICEYCEVSTLKSLRLSSSILCRRAEKWLYQEVLLFVHKVSLQRVQNIAESPRLSGHVESLWVHGDQPEYVEFEEFQEKYHNQCREEPSARLHYSEEYRRQQEDLAEIRDELSDKEFYKAWQANQRAFQEKLEDAFRPSMSLSDLRHHHAERVRLYNESRFPEDTVCLDKTLTIFFQSCKRLCAVEISFGIKDPLHSNVLDHGMRYSQAHSNQEFKKGLLTEMALLEWREGGLGTMTGLIFAMLHARFAPKSMKINCNGSMLHLHDCMEMKPQSLARNLHDFVWKLPDDTPEDSYICMYEPDHFNSGCLLAHIRLASQLRRLTLAFSSACHEEIWMMPRLSGLVGKVTWPMLTSFKVYEIQATAFTMAAFLRRHSCLREIVLQNVYLSKGNWPGCLQKFAGKLPNLLIFEPRGMLADCTENPWRSFGETNYIDDYPVVLSRYVIDGHGPFPYPPRDDQVAEHCRRRNPWARSRTD